MHGGCGLEDHTCSLAMLGYRIPRPSLPSPAPGLQVLQSMKEEERRSLTPLQLRKKAAEFALKTVDQQREQFKR